MLAAKSGKTAIIEGSMVNNLQDDTKKLLDFRIKAIETKMNQMQMKLVSLPQSPSSSPVKARPASNIPNQSNNDIDMRFK